MLKPEQVPDVVVEAAVAMRDRGGSMSDIIRTAINAWPGAQDSGLAMGKHSTRIYILPLPTENRDE